ncbi:hypothetical protein E4U55_006195 [Claviceps digitariae]|nr:hypothetical protein E4U55_006195 [Claviceps digitariae]
MSVTNHVYFALHLGHYRASSLLSCHAIKTPDVLIRPRIAMFTAGRSGTLRWRDFVPESQGHVKGQTFSASRSAMGFYLRVAVSPASSVFKSPEKLFRARTVKEFAQVYI